MYLASAHRKLNQINHVLQENAWLLGSLFLFGFIGVVTTQPMFNFQDTLELFNDGFGMKAVPDVDTQKKFVIGLVRGLEEAFPESVCLLNSCAYWCAEIGRCILPADMPPGVYGFDQQQQLYGRIDDFPKMMCGIFNAVNQWAPEILSECGDQDVSKLFGLQR